ncbi:Aspartate--tRNA(Asp/Asn) ligase [uncultured archaeon]|nr:Aspartate--tRNA(Asp/Asn) ligase [uncultured archaeon]
MMKEHYISEVPLNQETTIAGWVHEVRDTKNFLFFVLRDKTGKIQVTIKKGENELSEKAIKLVREDCIQLKGISKESKIANAGIEFVPTELTVLGKVEGIVPIDVTGRVAAELDTRLDYRSIDLRRDKIKSIFKIKSKVVQEFRNYLSSRDFEELHVPSILGSSTEGGTELFEIKYFEKKAYLSQSPQLYKQLAVLGGYDKVYITTPVFRAEKHNTLSHLNECMQLDIEMGFCDNNDAMKVLGETFIAMLKKASEMQKELEAIGTQIKLPSEEVPIVTYKEIIERLQKIGSKTQDGEDLSKDDEKLIYEKLGYEYVIIKDYPTKVRAFYSLPYLDGESEYKNKEYCKSYDLIYRGTEISSGAQRIHDPQLLTDQIKEKGLNPEDFKGYIDSFKYGSCPHAGWSIGAERITMKICNLENIREAVLWPRDRVRITP